MKTIKLVVSIVICQLAGVIGSLFTISALDSWYEGLKKASFNPPGWVFGPAWTILFLLMGYSLYLVWEKGFFVSDGSSPKKLWNPLSEKLWYGSLKEFNVAAVFAVQLVLNMLWSLLFFGLQSPGLAFSEILMLWFAILYTIMNFYRVSKTAAYLLIPYLLWVSFASVLNFMVWYLN